jgi:hypothetical protein
MFNEKEEIKKLDELCNDYKDHIEEELREAQVKKTQPSTIKILNSKLIAIEDIINKFHYYKMAITAKNGTYIPHNKNINEATITQFQFQKDLIATLEKHQPTLNQRREKSSISVKFWKHVNKFISYLKNKTEWKATRGVTGAKQQNNFLSYFERRDKDALIRLKEEEQERPNKNKRYLFDEQKEIAELEKACKIYEKHLEKEKKKISLKLKNLSKYTRGVLHHIIIHDIHEYRESKSIIDAKKSSLQDLSAALEKHQIALTEKPQDQSKTRKALYEALIESQPNLENRRLIGISGKFWKQIHAFMKWYTKNPLWESTKGITGARLTKNIYHYFELNQKREEPQPADEKKIGLSRQNK